MFAASVPALSEVVEARKLGEWKAVEKDMEEWAQKRGRLRRTEVSCKKRLQKLEPEKFEQYFQVPTAVPAFGDVFMQMIHQYTVFRFQGVFSAENRLQRSHYVRAAPVTCEGAPASEKIVAVKAGSRVKTNVIKAEMAVKRAREMRGSSAFVGKLRRVVVGLGAGIFCCGFNFPPFVLRFVVRSKMFGDVA